MDNEKLLFYRKKFAENAKADKFIRGYFKSHGNLPTAGAVNIAKALTESEVAAVEFSAQVSSLVDRGSVIPAPIDEVVAEWEYIWNEETWNESYANGLLKDYYEWADGLSPYKEDLWNTVAQRPANWSDIEKENGKPIEYEDGYHYTNCVRCWQGALNAPEAKYPWCCVKIDEPFVGAVKLEYEDAEVYPWGENREFKRTFAIESIPSAFGEEYKLDGNGETTFDPSKLVATLVKR